ncbi:MAG TPA: MFS transporter, partial [Vicinamibacteria bacterium]
MASSASAAPAPRPLTTTEWLICGVAALGFAFDIYEILMLPLIVGPALQEFLGLKAGMPEYNRWV